jgi:hypothetical protein
MASDPILRKRKRLSELPVFVYSKPDDTSIVPETVVDSLSQIRLSQRHQNELGSYGTNDGHTGASAKGPVSRVQRMRYADGSQRRDEQMRRTQTVRSSRFSRFFSAFNCRFNQFDDAAAGERSTLPRVNSGVHPKKPLGPVPAVSPSKFKPYLAPQSTPTSSIELFSSPEKDQQEADVVDNDDGSWDGRGPTRDALRQGLDRLTQSAQHPQPRKRTSNAWLQNDNRRRTLAELVPQTQPSAGNTTSIPETPGADVASALAAAEDLAHGEEGVDHSQYAQKVSCATTRRLSH